MILHIINKSPFTHSCFKECLNVSADGCSILFIEDGVVAVNALSQEQLETLDKRNISLYALKADIEARGLNCPAPFQNIDDDGFVDLTVSHHSSQSWF